MTTLYYSPSACSLAPHIVLEWIGQPYEAKRVKYGSAELLAVNPAGAVPTLREDDGWLLTQAGAILEYLAAKHPEADLSGGDGLRDAAEAHRWSSFFTGDLHPSFFPVFSPRRYTTETGAEAQEATKAAGIKLVQKNLKLLDDHLDGRDWILGEGKGKRSVIDAYAFPMLRWAIRMLPDGLADYPNAQALHDRLADDAQVKKVLDKEAA